jgi:hypothetical protein
MKIIKFSRGNRRIGLIKRNSVNGPEKKLINTFIKYIPNLITGKKSDIAIFYEPKIESGFPDIVVVQYSPAVFENWNNNRNKLRTSDVKFLHYFSCVKSVLKCEIIDNLGVDSKLLDDSLYRLLEAGLISKSKDSRWRIKPLKNIYGVRSLIAIEAKVKNWSTAFNQGQLDQWFASESYILSPIETPSSTTVSKSYKTGVGIILLNGKNIKVYRKAEKLIIPSSYGSWMFNEWIGRYLHNREL